MKSNEAEETFYTLIGSLMDRVIEIGKKKNTVFRLESSPMGKFIKRLRKKMKRTLSKKKLKAYKGLLKDMKKLQVGL